MAKLSEDDIRLRVEEKGMKLNSYCTGNRNRIFVNVSCKQGHTYDIRLDSLMVSNGCKYCNKTARYTYEDVKTYIESQGYKLISDKYVNIDKSIEVECEKGHRYEVSFGNFKHRESRCPYCNGGGKFSYEYVKSYIESVEGYRLISTNYENTHTKILIQCDRGHAYETTFGIFKHNGCRCSECYGVKKFTYNYVEEYIKSFNYKLISKSYRNKESKIRVECDKGHRYSVTFGNFRNGCRCPICDESKGERRIRNFLESINETIIPQKEFDGLLGVGNCPLSYDFYLPQYNTLIEYQGEFHDGTGRKQTDENFKKQREHDSRKAEYAKFNKINLLEIWYWDFDNIEEILTRELKLSNYNEIPSTTIENT